MDGVAQQAVLNTEAHEELVNVFLHNLAGHKGQDVHRGLPHSPGDQNHGGIIESFSFFRATPEMMANSTRSRVFMFSTSSQLETGCLDLSLCTGGG